jgi:hypothetical protein
MFLLAGSRTASAQLISIGVKGGLPITDQVSSRNDESRPYIIGPSIEVRLPAGFAVEAAALYERIGSSSTFIYGRQDSTTASVTTRQRGNSWEFPLLGKYYFRPHSASWQPYLGTGYSFRTVHLTTDGSILSGDFLNAPSVAPYHIERGTGLGIGATFAAGVRFRYNRFAVLPEIRYTRWGDPNESQRPRNDAKFLLGITF